MKEKQMAISKWIYLFCFIFLMSLFCFGKLDTAYAGTNSYTSWDGIEWNYTTSNNTLYIRKRSGGDGTADATSSASNYPWYNLRSNVKTIDVAGDVSSIGTNAFRVFYASNVYLRYNGNMNIGNYALYIYANHTLHISPANKNAIQSDQNYNYSRTVAYDLGYQNSWYSWDGIEWRFDGSTLYIRKRSGGDGTADATTSANNYPWSHLSNKVKTIDVAGDVSSIGTNAFRVFYASNVYLRYNGNMNIGNYALYIYANHTLHISPANKNAIQSDQNYNYSRTVAYDLGYQNSWYSWDGIEWRFDGSTLYIRKRSGGDGTADATTSANNYPWSHLSNKVKTIDVARDVSSIGTNAFRVFYATNVYLRYNGNMNIGNYALYIYANHTLHIWKANKNAIQSDQNYNYSRTITYFDNTGVQCSHPAASLSGWLTSGNTHYKACSQCGNWSTSHNRLSSWKWQSNGTNHWRYCNTCGTTWDSAAHSFGSWYGNTATCTAGGVQYKKCGTCSYVTSATTTALGHSWSAEYADTDGYVKKKCTRSGCTSIQTLHGIYYTIQYDGNEATSGTTESSSHEYGKATVLTTNGYNRTGYTFDSWNTKADGSGTKYEDRASVINLTTSHNSTITLYAQWNVNNYPVTYIVHDITLNADLITFTHDRNYGTIVSGSEIDSELNPTAEGVFYINGDERPYKLLTEDDNETLYTTAKVSTAGATIYRYCRLNEIELSFDPVVFQTDYSCDLSVKKVIPGKTYGELPTPKIKDYMFEGWYTKKSGGEQITADMIVSETQAFTVYAHWTKLPPKIISYDKEVKVIEDLGITEDEYLKQYGSLNTNFIQNDQLLYPYQTATIEVEVGGGEKTLTNSWAFQIKENDTWVLLVSYDNKTVTKDGISYKTWANKDQTKIYLGITGATRQNKNIEYKAIVTNNAGSVASGAIPLTVYWLPNIRNQ